MTRFSVFRNLVSSSRVWLMTGALLFAQLGVVSHPLHKDWQRDSQKADVTCEFCIAGTHLQTAPVVPAVDFTRSQTGELVVRVRHVCDVGPLVTPRLTRGPPLSTLCV